MRYLTELKPQYYCCLCILGITVGGQQFPAYQVQGGSGNLSGFQIVHQPIQVQQQQQQQHQIQQGQIQPGQVITLTTQDGLTLTTTAQPQPQVIEDVCVSSP